MAAGFEEMDLGGPGLVYVHHPELARFWKTHQDSRAGLIGLLRGKTRPWTLVAGFRIDRFKQNTILTNSDWTGNATTPMAFPRKRSTLQSRPPLNNYRGTIVKTASSPQGVW